MTQTPISKAIQSVEDRMNATNNEARWGELNAVHIILKTLLPYEREVIEGAYRQGSKDMDKAHWQVDREHQDKSDYFTKTFTNNAD